MANDLLPTDNGRFSSAALLTHGSAGVPFMGPTASTGTTSTTTTTTATTTTTTTNLTATTTSILTTFTATLNNKNDFCNKYDEDRPCEKYKQFLDSSRQERTFMIEKLVEIFANVIDSIWHPKFLLDQQKAKVIPTRGFCNEILKRSNTTYATLQISLFYVFRIKKVVHEKLFRRYQAAQNPQQMKLPRQTHLDDLMCCGRRMFLASLMVASKYLHDKNYHNKAWSKITGLDIKEINAAEMAFLKLIDYRLHVSKPTFDKWYTQLHGHIQREHKSAALIVNHSHGHPNMTPTSSMLHHGNAHALPTQPPLSLPREDRMDNPHHEQNYPSPPPDVNAQGHATAASASSSFALPSPPLASTAAATTPLHATLPHTVSTTSSSLAPTVNVTLNSHGQPVTTVECSSMRHTTTSHDSYARADSGVSFDLLSPPLSQKQQTHTMKVNFEASHRPTGVKRPSDEDIMAHAYQNKRRYQQQ